MSVEGADSDFMDTAAFTATMVTAAADTVPVLDRRSARLGAAP